MKKLISLTALLVTTSVLATSHIPLEEQVGSITVTETTFQGLKARGNIVPPVDPMPPGAGGFPPGGGGFPPAGGGFPGTPGQPDTLERTGRVISVAKDIVALGEAIYDLVRKGKPTNVTDYAPMSVVPKDPVTKEHVDPFELEGFSIPVQRDFTTRITNGLGKEVVRFDYTVIYSYGGSYNETGSYLMNVIIVPKFVKTTFGWDFNATMKLSGIMNHGSRANPVAGIMVTMKYQMNSWSAAFERNDTIHITGKGQLQSYGIR